MLALHAGVQQVIVRRVVCIRVLEGHAHRRAVAVQEYSLIERHGVCIRVLGDLALLPASVRAAADRVMAATQHHTRGRLNICLSYRWPFAALWPVLHAGDVAEPLAGAVCLGLLSDVMSGTNIAGEPNKVEWSESRFVGKITVPHDDFKGMCRFSQ